MIDRIHRIELVDDSNGAPILDASARLCGFQDLRCSGPIEVLAVEAGVLELDVEPNFTGFVEILAPPYRPSRVLIRGEPGFTPNTVALMTDDALEELATRFGEDVYLPRAAVHVGQATNCLLEGAEGVVPSYAFVRGDEPEPRLSYFDASAPIPGSAWTRAGGMFIAWDIPLENGNGDWVSVTATLSSPEVFEQEGFGEATPMGSTQIPLREGWTTYARVPPYSAP